MAILKIRFLQIYREWLKLNWIYRLLMLAAPPLIVGAIAWQASTDESTANTIAIVMGLVIFSMHQSRKDKRMLTVQFDNCLQIFTIEYFAFSLPVFACLIFTLQWKSVLILLACIIFTLTIKLNFVRTQSVQYTFLKVFLPHYEWVSGLRKSGLIFLIIFLLSCVLSFLPYVTISLLFLLTVLVMGFYNEYEPLDLLVLFKKNSWQFLFYKIKSMLKIYGALVILPNSLYIIFHRDEWYIIVAFFILCILALMATLILKYKSYYPHGEINSAGVIQAMVTISILFPLILPIPLFVIFYYLPQAGKNLNSYLHDFN